MSNGCFFPWIVCESRVQHVGYVKEAQNWMFIIVRNAGHMVPADQTDDVIKLLLGNRLYNYLFRIQIKLVRCISCTASLCLCYSLASSETEIGIDKSLCFGRSLLMHFSDVSLSILLESKSLVTIRNGTSMGSLLRITTDHSMPPQLKLGPEVLWTARTRESWLRVPVKWNRRWCWRRENLSRVVYSH
jgi:hypothetical protein